MIHHKIASEITSNTMKILADLSKLALIKFHMEAALNFRPSATIITVTKIDVEQNTSPTFAME
jgi:hypothetical protein